MSTVNNIQNGGETQTSDKVTPITLESIDLEKLEWEAKERAKKKVANLLQVCCGQVKNDLKSIKVQTTDK